MSTLELTDLHVQAIQRRFESRQMQHNIPFTSLFASFQKGQTLQEIGYAHNVSGETIRKIYNLFFRDLLGARQIRKTRQRARHETRFFSRDVNARIAVKAQEAGCTVSLLEKGTRVNQTQIYINGNLCSIHHPTVAWRPGNNKRWFTRSTVSRYRLSMMEGTLFYAAIQGFSERLFVIPNEIMEHASSQRGSNFTVYIPLEQKSIYNNRRSNIDWWKYENAWHLLTPKTPPTL